MPRRRERAGSASALSETAAELGGALGIAVLGSLAAAIYRSRMAGAATGDLPPDLARAAEATLGGAVEGARMLSAETAATLLAAARGAFNLGFQVTAILAAIAMTIAAALTVTVLRDARQNEGHA